MATKNRVAVLDPLRIKGVYILVNINRFKKCIALNLFSTLAAASALLLSGCQNNGYDAQSTPATSASTPTEAQSAALPTPQLTTATSNENRVEKNTSDGAATQCQRELLALSKVNPAAYADKKRAFDTLLRNASVYSSVREEINAQTKDTLDSLYKYKTQKLCSDIEQTIQQGLISRGESVR